MGYNAANPPLGDIAMKTGFAAGRFYIVVFAVVAFSISNASGVGAWEGEGPLVIDHACTDLSKIPPAWIDSTCAEFRFYYAHASHGKQITEGLRLIEERDPVFSYEMAYLQLPADTVALCVNENHLANPYNYFLGSGLNQTRAMLDSNPDINYSMFMWCDEPYVWPLSEVERYFAAMEILEAEYPQVTFIYATGNAQMTGTDGYRRWLFNERIREYCRDNEKILFDFGDMDAWWYNPGTQAWEQNTYEYEGNTIPVEHSQYYGEEWGHTTFESCEVKGRAMWWTAALLAGWFDSSPTGTEDTPVAGALDQNFPNPFNPVTRIAFNLGNAGHARLDIFDPAGRLVKTLVDGNLPAARHEVTWDGRDGSGRQVSSGVYFYSIITDDFRDTKKMILLR
jgi:hypothetical protein